SRARTQFPAAQALEKMGKIPGALTYYREIARTAPDSEPGRQATARISKLTGESGVGSRQ
ncbi:tetratricopeptide repeat protein, partial [Singulisphaera rosea]